MKKLFLLLFLGMTLSVSAQQNGERGGQMCELQGMMQGRQQRKIEVAPENKEAFEALKKEYHAERKAVAEKYLGKKLEKDQKPTEEQMDAFMKQGYAKRKALLELEEKYYGKFRKFLAPWQAAQAVKVGGFNGQRNNHKAFRGGNHGKKHQYGNKHHDAKCGAKCDACPKKQECEAKK